MTLKKLVHSKCQSKDEWKSSGEEDKKHYVNCKMHEIKLNPIIFMTLSRFPLYLFLAPVVQRVDSTIHWINHYSIGFDSMYPIDIDLCAR